MCVLSSSLSPQVGGTVAPEVSPRQVPRPSSGDPAGPLLSPAAITCCCLDLYLQVADFVEAWLWTRCICNTVERAQVQ